ncbi:MAG: glutamine synthetase [Clostridiales bacterium]|nr:glutamine synthetase [Clostridiales bacterium]
MNYSQREVLQYVEENDVKFVKLTFCDLYGNLKNISILSKELSTAFIYGFYVSARKITGFSELAEDDLMLFPDETTMTVLPWRPQQGRVVRFFCYIKYRNGNVFDGDGRYFLNKAVEVAKGKGYNFQFGTSCEFYLFKTTEEGIPTKIPHDFGGYCDVAPNDKGENVRREVCLTLEQMGVQPESSRHEGGPGQNEIDFKFLAPLSAADTFLSFKSTVKNIASQNGLFASFMPKPLFKNDGNGMHIHINATKNGLNIFKLDNNSFSEEAQQFAAGIMKRVNEMAIFTNSTANSYRRLGENSAPRYISWAHSDYSQLMRIPLSKKRGGEIILRSPDCACNPYFVIGLLIYACLEGVENKLKISKEVSENLVNLNRDLIKKYDVIPKDLGEAISYAQKSEFLKKYLPKEIYQVVIDERQAEWEEYKDISIDNRDVFEERKYFYSL